MIKISMWKSKSELQNAIKQAKCDLENHQINEINKAKSSQEMWHKIHKFFGNTNSQLVEPLKDGHSYTFDDQKISNKLRDVHVLHKNDTTHNFDDDFKDHIEQSVNNCLRLCQPIRGYQ